MPCAVAAARMAEEISPMELRPYNTRCVFGGSLIQSSPCGHSRRAAQKRVTGGRWRRIVLGHVLAERVLELRGRARLSLAVEVAGVLAATAPLGMPSGKIAHHPGWRPLQGSASDHVPG
eukprot:scaffold41763_cov34-Phaeocystis_antarctica.AAC.3